MSDEVNEDAPAGTADTAESSGNRGIAGSTARALRAARSRHEPVPAAGTAEAPVTETGRDTAATDARADADPAAEAIATTAAADADPATDADAGAGDDAGANTPDDVDEGTERDTDTEPPVQPSARRSRAAAGKAVERTRRRPDTLVTVCAAAALVAVIFAAASAVVWWRAGHAAADTIAATRDEVAVDARLAITTVNTSDYRRPDAALSNWIDVSTGTLRSEFTDSRKQAVQLLAQAKKITSATVLDAAVTRLDTGKGSATVIASVNVSRKGTTGSTTTTRNRFRATMTRVRGEWRLADLALVPVQLT